MFLIYCSMLVYKTAIRFDKIGRYKLIPDEIFLRLLKTFKAPPYTFE